MKPKANLKGIPARDRCQTPPYALSPLLPYLSGVIWEPAAGEGYLVRTLQKHGLEVVATDILTGQDFFTHTEDCDIIVTNPPFSLKYKWLARCYELGKPFALLMPLETLGTAKAQPFFRKHGMDLMVLSRRVNFKMPNKGWKGHAQFPTAWFTWKLGLPERIVYGWIPKNAHRELLQRVEGEVCSAQPANGSVPVVWRQGKLG